MVAIAFTPGVLADSSMCYLLSTGVFVSVCVTGWDFLLLLDDW